MKAVVVPGLAGRVREWDDVRALAPIPVEVVETTIPGRLEDPRLEAVVDRLESVWPSGPAVLVAHSMGSFPAEAFAARHPDELTGVVLIDPSVDFEPSRLAARLAPLLEVVPITAVRGFGRYYEWAWDLAQDRSETLEAPALVLTAASARRRAVRRQQELADRFGPGSKARVVPGSRHNLHRTHPDAVADAIRELIGG